MIYYRRYIGSYQKRTMRLDPTDHGVYDLMLDYCYAEEQPLPLDIDDIHSICKATKPEHQRSVQKILSLYFIRQSDGYHNLRCDEEIQASQQARENGKHGGRPRTRKQTGTQTGHETGSETGPSTGTETEPITGTETRQATEPVTETLTGMGHPTTYNLQPTTYNLQPASDSPQPPPSPDSPRSAAPSASAAPKASLELTPGKPPEGNGKAKPEARTRATWSAYSAAYLFRYGVEPVRNAKVNGQLAKFIERVPIEEAPGIAGFFVQSDRRLYLSAKHPVDLLLRDAEALRTEWATKTHGTEAQAAQGDQTAAAGQVWQKLIREAEEDEQRSVGGVSP